MNIPRRICLGDGWNILVSPHIVQLTILVIDPIGSPLLLLALKGL
jgi:hypothetical protein